MATKITKLNITNDKISGRGGLALILRYIEKTRLNTIISGVFLTKVKVHSKGFKTPTLSDLPAKTPATFWHGRIITAISSTSIYWIIPLWNCVTSGMKTELKTPSPQIGL